MTGDGLPGEVYAADADYVRVAMKRLTAERMANWLRAYAEYETVAGNTTTAEHADHMADRLEKAVTDE